MVADVDTPMLVADLLLDHGMIINMAKRQLDWIELTIPPTVVAEQVYCILKEDLKSVEMERQIVATCLLDREGQSVRFTNLAKCLLKPNRGFMDRTEVMVARVLVNTNFAKVSVQLTIMHETKLLKGAVLRNNCPVKKQNLRR